MLSTTPSGRRQYLDLESNQDLDFRRVPCGPLHYRDTRADDWICTSIIRFTRPAPIWVEPRRRLKANSFQPSAFGREGRLLTADR